MNIWIRYLLIICLFILTFRGCAPTITELENKLDNDSSGGERETAYKILSIDKFNTNAIVYILYSFNKLGEQDSIKVFWDKLINNNKDNIMPYYLRLMYAYYECRGKDEDNFKLQYLKKIYSLDSTIVDINYPLGEHYYELFISEYKKNHRNRILNKYADTSYTLLSKVWNMNDSLRYLIDYPLMQLTSYLTKSEEQKVFEKYQDQHDTYYRKLLPKNWKHNYSLNIFQKTTAVSFDLFTYYLEIFKEPALSSINTGSTIYRFIWFRSFNNPITIKIEKDNDNVNLSWKEIERNRLYSPEKLIVNKTKSISLGEWEGFISRINSYNFWTKQNQAEQVGVDGSLWILEGCQGDMYKHFDIYSPKDDDYRKIGLYLLNLTDLQIPKDEIY